MTKSNKIKAMYDQLLGMYGPQGWWPIINDDTLLCDYHRKAPKNGQERFEICVGAILTQNTSWKNVEKALGALKRHGALDPKSIVSMPAQGLAALIRPAGYYNQKAKKLKLFSEFYLSLASRRPSREELLNIWGVGPETADSMLLYAYGVPEFVVDAYTRRVFADMLDGKSYDEIKSIFEKNLPRDAELYKEYHALIVEHAKRLR